MPSADRSLGPLASAGAGQGGAAARAASAALDYLARLQEEAGYWTDFWLRAGTSDAWVTAAVGSLLSETAPHLDGETAAQARSCARRAADWLLANGRHGGWGYNSAVPADADSTAWVILLLESLGMPVPDEAIAFLVGHQHQGGRFRTYRFGDGHAWGRPSLDVSLNAANALLAAGAWSQDDGRAYWRDVLAPAQELDGTFRGDWWAHAHFPTWLARRLWHRLDHPDLHHPWPSPAAHARAGASPFLLALAGASPIELAADQLLDGSFRTHPILRVPPSHDGLRQVRPVVVPDARRVFTTATVLTHLPVDQDLSIRQCIRQCTDDSEPTSPPSCAQPTGAERPLPTTAAEEGEAPGGVPSARVWSNPPRSQYGHRCDAIFRRVAEATGLDAECTDRALTTFQTLTRQSLGALNAWPAPQLSSLSMGEPIEFSATSEGPGVAVSGPPATRATRAVALRYTCEVTDPVLPAARRIRTGLVALEAAAAALGCGDLWARLAPVWTAVATGERALPAGARFTIWGGIDQPAAGPATLKVYVATLHQDQGGGRARLRRLLAAAGIPRTTQLQHACDVLDAVGFPQEVGFGLRDDGRWGAKIYYEFHGWRPALVDRLASDLGFPVASSALSPEVPGVLSATQAAHRRSGLSFSVDPRDGDVLSLTSTAAFPAQLVPLAATHARISAWLDDATAYTRIYDALVPNVASRLRLFSLLTRTLGHDGATRTAVYLRAPVGTEQDQGVDPDSDDAAVGGSDRLRSLSAAVRNTKR